MLELLFELAKSRFESDLIYARATIRDRLNQTISTYNKIAHRYAEFRWGEVSRWRVLAYKNFIKYNKGTEVLDVGCGPGKDAAILISKGFNVIGVDASRGLIDEAKSRVPKGTFILGDLRNLRFKKKFDGIWCCASLLHVKKTEAQRAINSFKNLLKGNGILFVALKEGDGECIKTYKDGSKRFFAYYRKVEAVRLVSEEFEIIKTYVSAKDKHDDRWIEIFARVK